MRFFVASINEDRFELKGEEFVHLAFVLRAKAGQEVVLCDGSGTEYTGVVEKICKDRATIAINLKKQSQAEPAVELTLYQAAARNEKLELIAKMLTELGAKRMRVFFSKYCSTKPEMLRIERLQKISFQAAKQCGRAVVLELDEGLSFSQMLDELSGYDLVLFANEHEQDNSIRDVLKNTDFINKKVAVVVGCEGGFTEDEVQELCKKSTSVTLGKRILRMETAAAIMAAFVLAGN